MKSAGKQQSEIKRRNLQDECADQDEPKPENL